MSAKNDEDFIRNLRKSGLFGVTEMIIKHPYIVALENKEINKDKLELFVFEQYHIIKNDRRNFALMVSKASSDTAAKLFLDCLSAEGEALDNLAILTKELGVSINGIESYEPLAGCSAYTNYLTRLAVYGSDAEILTAMLIDFPVWGANCGKMSSALKKKYSYAESSCVFLDKFAAPMSEDFVSKSNKLIKSALPTYEKEIRRAARLILEYELSFWDTIYKYSRQDQL
jgi:thiaminase